MSFTPAQQQVIEYDGHLLVVAGPGSGKTTTSVAKALRILANPRRSLIMVTFTKEGAVEIRRRLDAAQEKAGGTPFGEERLVIATFHSIAIKHLSRHVPRQRVLSPAHQSLLLDDAMHARLKVTDPKEARLMFERYMYAVDRTALDMPSDVREVIQRYRELLRDTGQTDLYSIMRDCALKVYSGEIEPMPFTDMLVDEGQDTDDLQKHWIFAHARKGCQVTIVGDDDQSIYEWRQALGYDGMKSFMDTFSAKRIELGDNFRCRSEVLFHAIALIEQNKRRLQKHLVARRGKGGSIVAYRTASAEQQAQSLAQLISSSPQQHADAAILARQNISLDLLEMELKARGVTYRRIGKSIWENPVIAGYLSFLQSLYDNSTVGVISVLRHHGIDEEVKTALMREMDGHAGSFLDGHVPKLQGVSSTERKKLQDLSSSCAYWRNQLRPNDMGTGGSVREVIMEVGDLYATWLARKNSDRLVRTCADILSHLKGTLSSRLRLVTTKTSIDDKPALLLMTMHGSKGLEFETVHVIDASASDSDSTVANYEAERRLMYVALTRAKNRCMVWFSGKPHATVTEAKIAIENQFAVATEIFTRGA